MASWASDIEGDESVCRRIRVQILTGINMSAKPNNGRYNYSPNTTNHFDLTVKSMKPINVIETYQ